jgi:Nif-specific regulatory protein
MQDAGRAEPPLPSATAATRDFRQLGMLLAVNQALSGMPNLRTGLRRVLEILDHHGGLRSAVTVLNPGDGQVRIEVSSAHSAGAQHASHRLGNGVTARVLEKGKPVVVPQVSRELMVANRFAGEAPDTNETSFICVPILLNRKTAGALSIYLRFRAERDYEGWAALLAVVASMIAQAFKIDGLVDADRRKLVDEDTDPGEALRPRCDFSFIVGNSVPIRHVYDQISQVAATNTTVLIRGESGTGKELIAHAIHYNSRRSGKPFVKVSAAALPDSLIESELFGFEKGAFTGAEARRKGRFELADGGTLFLDEIGDVPLSTQVRLLRALQERQFERLGGTEPVKVNVRLIAATNKDLEKAIAAGTFREDLHYRLNVFTICVPPLRERKSDILLLADHFLEKYAREHHKAIRRISTAALDMLAAYHWPGNVRELESTVARAVLVCDGNVVRRQDLPPTIQAAEASRTVPTRALDEAVAAYEKDLIEDALKTARGNRSKAAKLLRTTGRIISYKVKKYRLECSRFRS